MIDKWMDSYGLAQDKYKPKPKMICVAYSLPLRSFFLLKLDKYY